MSKLLVAVLLVLLGCTYEAPRNYERPDMPALSAVALHDPGKRSPYCGATRLTDGRIATAKHCVDFFSQNARVGYAVDARGESTSAYLSSLAADRDFALLTGTPSPYSVDVGTFREGLVLIVSHIPFRNTKRLVNAYHIPPTEATAEDGTKHLIEHLIAIAEPCAPGESGSGVYQDGKLVAVVTATNDYRCVFTLVL
jgi:hypothetical protein